MSAVGAELPVDADLPRRRAEYWREVLADAPEPLEVPADRPRPAHGDDAGALVRLELDEELVTAFKALEMRHSAHVSTVLLAAWAAVLGRLSGQTDLVIGTSVGGVNPLPVRMDLSGSPTAVELVERVEARVQGALRNGDLPLARLVEFVQPGGADASATPLFRAAFAWRDVSARATTVREPRSTSGVDLSLELRKEEDRIVGEVVFATALFDRETVERYAEYLRRVLAGMAADETRPVDRLPLLPADERRRVTEEWNRTAAPYPATFIHEMFEAQAERTPDAVAVVYEDRQLTYGELNGRVNRLAHHLRSLDVGPDVRVGICVEREPELVVAVLGVLKAGGAYLPLDPGYPRERLLDMVQDCAPVVMLTQDALADRLAGLNLPLLALDEGAAWWAEQPDTDPERAALTPEHLTYVIYTSGSTGRPKGVEMTHGGASNLLHWYLGATGMSDRDAVLVVTSFSFHLTQRNLMAPLFVGGQVHLAREPFEPHRIAAQIVASGISMMNVTPTGFQALVGHAIGGLRIVVFGGEPLYPRQLARVPEPRPVFLNPYGSTEATGITTHHFARVDLSSYGSRAMPPGRPIANAQIYVLDGVGEPVPVGVTGELYLGGAGVTRGYRRLPAQTAERYLPDPFAPTPGARMYRTGDLGRWLPDGTVEFMGRGDAQVKVRGFRIELGEIEARLAEHAAVHEVVVVARDGEIGDPRLVAYYTGDETRAAALRGHLAERLPEYMVPAAFVHMDALPVNPNGKLDRKALPAPEFASDEEAYVAPRTAVEEVLAGIWAEVLGVARLGVEASFFELGGHSLLATRVVSRVREVFAVELPLRAFFEGPTVAELTVRVEEMRRAGMAVLPPVVPTERTQAPPLSFAQQRLWFLEQMGNLGGTYHIPMRLRLRGGLDRGALARSLDRIVARHEALRTSFPTVDGEPVQRIAPAAESAFRLVEHDLQAAPEAEDELHRLVSDEAGAPFDLAQGPLIRGRLVRMAADDHVLLLTMHHIVSDGWSMGVLHRELGALYAAFARGQADPLPPLPVQYADYAAWHRRLVEGEVLRRQAEYWRETLAGAPELLELPTDHPRPAKQDFAGASVNVELDEALAAALRTLGQRHGTTLFMTLLAGWAAVLARLSGQDEVVVGTPTANRGRSEIEGLIGFFVNTLALRVDLSGSPSVAELLGRVKERALAAQHHQDIPFEQVVEHVHPVRSLAHTPVFQVMFGWQNAPGGSLAMPGLALGPLDPAGSGGSPFPASAKTDLSLTLWEEGGRIAGVVEYATALFDRATVQRHVGYLRRVLEQMAADDAAPVDRLKLLSAAERHTVVEAWNATGAAFPADACIHELFEAQVERTPGAVAVTFERERLTYAELNAQANRLAHHLRALGVGPEVRVAVCVKRGMETVVALLAVLKAGGGYVPLDPMNPEDRLRYALADSAPAALLTGGPLVARFADAGMRIVNVDAPAAWDAYPASNPDRARSGVRPEHLAYVIYTSGSTGRPKGVLVRHGSLVSLLAVTRAAFGVGPGDVMPALASSAFDISLFELLLPLVAGAELRLVLLQRVMDARALMSEIADVTLLHAVPALMREIAEVERRAPRLARLRGTFVGGDQVPADLLAEMSAAFPAARTHILYGPTEATILASAHAVPADGAVAGHPIGRPLGNVRLYVCDPLGQPQPVGVAGELLIGGAGVARGYLGRPALTAERFVPDPFSTAPGARLYRTGDRVRWKESGVLDFLGRTDFQVKIRGFRIELGEIEARLREHPAVRQAAVLAREDVPGRKRLVAYVVGEAPADALKAHLEARLPGYMVPGVYVRLETLPLTSNGKLDRRALPVPDAAAFARRGLEPPRNMTEHVLAEIWAEVLGVELVGRRDHFFDLGGHSLLAVRVIARVREALNPAATVDEVFAYPTLYQLAARLERSGEWLGATRAIPVRETGSERPLFLVHDVLGFVFYAQVLRPHLDPEIPVYALPGPLNDPDELHSLDDLVTRLVRMITEVQPEGPYRVAGWSAGGAFAYAVAERLISTGREVEFVGLLDTVYPRPLAGPDSPVMRQHRVLGVLAWATGEMRPTPEAIMALRVDADGLDMAGFIAECKARALLPQSVTVAQAEEADSRLVLLERSYVDNVPGPLPVPVHLFSSDDAEAEGDLRRGWADLPGGAPFRVVRVPGNHNTMWTKGNVEIVGAAISRAVRASAAAGN
ncbi:amino acid adenylation domain-containing protein [Longimicrobium sp.]|uniref:amino acid adenylation domain-containing protein n=1 Tax=Longimicrobium sp. TaxID=2029185 RepID=UPI003B3BA8A7